MSDAAMQSAYATKDESAVRWQKQRFLHDPANGTFGDCDRTAMACLLGINPDDVPHWGVHHDDAAMFNKVKEEWLASVGLFENFLYFDCSREQLAGNLRSCFKDAYVLLTGKSATGVHHVVVTLNGEIVHDPAINNSGIVGPCDDGLWQVSFLMPLTMKAPKSAGSDQ